MYSSDDEAQYLLETLLFTLKVILGSPKVFWMRSN